MLYLKQFMIIALIALAGESISFLIPLPIPSSIHGILILLFLLLSGKLRVESIKHVSSFLLAVMPVMFVPATAGLMDSFSLLAPYLLAYIAVITVSTAVVMGVSGVVTQRIIRRKAASKEDRHA